MKKKEKVKERQTGSRSFNNQEGETTLNGQSKGDNLRVSLIAFLSDESRLSHGHTQEKGVTQEQTRSKVVPSFFIRKPFFSSVIEGL